MQSDRLNKVFECVNEVHCLCGVLGLDFGQTVSNVHPSLNGGNQEQSTNISNNTLEGLEHAIVKLKSERKARIQKVITSYFCVSVFVFLCMLIKILFIIQLKEIAASLFELWNLMDSPKQERNSFSKITFVIRFSESEVTEPGVLSTEIIQQVIMHSEIPFDVIIGMQILWFTIVFLMAGIR